MKVLYTLLLSYFFITLYLPVQAQEKNFSSSFTTKERRENFKKYLFEKTIKETFRGPLNYTTEHKFEDACLSVTQFLLKNEEVKNGFNKMFNYYSILSTSTRQAFLTAVYATYPHDYKISVEKILHQENDIKNFCIAVVYLYRADSTRATQLLNTIDSKFPAIAYTTPLLVELRKYITQQNSWQKSKTPEITQLFTFQRLLGQKIIYSFQRWNRDYNGIAILQNKDGSFARDANGALITIQQLARAGSNLPYFITNGNTPQGFYRIAGIGHSINHLIGPTTNLQTILPFQNDFLFWKKMTYDSTYNAYNNYQRLLPPSWLNYTPIYESFYAGLIGRRYIIAHGTTIDPSFFTNEKFFLNTPTDGCLSAPEIWNDNGMLEKSEQLKLAKAFTQTEDSTGFIVVININNRPSPVDIGEIDSIVKIFEGKQKASLHSTF